MSTDKFANMPPLRGTPRTVEFPTPAGYRQVHPAVLDVPPLTAKGRLFQRKRLAIGIAVAAVLHIALVLGWLLSPPLRLKVGYAPERWVPVVSIPTPAPVAAAAAAPSAASAGVPTPAAAVPGDGKRLHRSRPRSSSPKSETP